MNYSYITVLSNWLVGYDKYQKIYSKQQLKQSTYPNQFYLLKDKELDIGLSKASKLLDKIKIKNNKIIRIETSTDNAKKNLRNNRGWVINQNYINVDKVFIKNDSWEQVSIEDLTALAFKLDHSSLHSYQDLIPRTLSILPIAQACQAKCKFCFSESSISLEKEKRFTNISLVKDICLKAKEKGATRFVITGGGEPGLLNFDNLIQLIKQASLVFNKVVMITNGLFLSSSPLILEKLNELANNGLTTLCISRRSANDSNNKEIMGIDTQSEKILSCIHNNNINLNTRLICVLQKGGVEDSESLSKYLDYATSFDVKEICFKELYVSSVSESLYNSAKENIYSLENQVSLKEVINFLENNNFKIIERLPWGAPVYQGTWKDKQLTIAAYTEPSVGWERSNKICRSWNIMADNKVYASLEDLDSEIKL